TSSTETSTLAAPRPRFRRGRGAVAQWGAGAGRLCHEGAPATHHTESFATPIVRQVTCGTGEETTMTNVIDQIAAEQKRDDIPEFRAGDTLKVHVNIVEGNRSRVQVFQGI